MPFNLTHSRTLVMLLSMIKDSWCGWGVAWGAEIRRTGACGLPQMLWVELVPALHV